jgi:hypothetical protein
MCFKPLRHLGQTSARQSDSDNDDPVEGQPRLGTGGTREFYLRLPQESVECKVFRTMIPGEAAPGDKLVDGVLVDAARGWRAEGRGC